VADEAAYDRVREGVVVFLGTLARHLEPSDPKVCLHRPRKKRQSNARQPFLQLCMSARPRDAVFARAPCPLYTWERATSEQAQAWKVACHALLRCLALPPC
jgi:hypothetical protein